MSDTAAPTAPATLAGYGHEAMLNVLARAEPGALKALAEDLIGGLGEIEVLKSRSGLVMLPMRDTAKGTAFHLGEVLVAEAHVRAGGQEGYGMCRGRDLEAAMAMALIDLAVALGVGHDAVGGLVRAEEACQRADDAALLSAVEATRVDMETF